MKAIRTDVIVQIIEQQRTTESGLIIQGTDTSQQQQLRVVAVGDQVTEVTAGDVVIVDQNARGRGFDLSGQRYYVVKESEIVAVYQ
jgi:co-chaperonin GroES (HSP10)